MKDRKELDFVASTRCNLACKYCFLNKNKSYLEEDKKIEKALEDGSFLVNIGKSLEKMGEKKSDFAAFKLWGAETTCHLDLIGKHLPTLFEQYPNIDTIFFSTNMSYDIDLIINFMKRIEETAPRHIRLDIQVSIDGPQYILDRTRYVSNEVIRYNIDQIIDYCNSHVLKHLDLTLLYKTTMPFDLMEEICSSKSSYVDYVGFFDKEFCRYKDRSVNLDLKFLTPETISASPVMPVDFTQQQGIEVANLARWVDTIDLKKEGLTYFTETNLPLELYCHQMGKGEEFTTFSSCGQGSGVYLFRWDGSIVPCSSAIMEDYESYQKEVEGQDEWTENLDVIKPWFIYPNDPSKTPQDIKKELDKKKLFWTYQYHYLKTVAAGLMYDLALCGQISPVYKTDERLLFRHACRVIARGACYYNNMKSFGDPFIPQLGLIRIGCNGLFEYADNRRQR